MKNDGKIKMLCKPTPLAKERGASSLEYLMLGAVVIAILLLVIGNGDAIEGFISDTFEVLFQDVEDAATSVGDEA